MSVLEENQKVLDRLGLEFGEAIRDAHVKRPHMGYVRVEREKLREVVSWLKDSEGFTHVITISGIDYADNYEVVYHLRRRDYSLGLKVPVPKDDPKVPSITDIINGAVFYEREVKDLLGIHPEGHPDPKRLVLSWDWPEGVHPLRKEWTVESLKKAVNGENHDE